MEKKIRFHVNIEVSGREKILFSVLVYIAYRTKKWLEVFLFLPSLINFLFNWFKSITTLKLFFPDIIGKNYGPLNFDGRNFYNLVELLMNQTKSPNWMEFIWFHLNINVWSMDFIKTDTHLFLYLFKNILSSATTSNYSFRIY